MRRSVVCALFLLSFLAGSGVAQQSTTPVTVPRFVRFAGAVSNSDGSPRTGVVAVMFSLYAQEEGGRALWTELQNVQLDTRGQYTVLLGSQHVDGVPADLFTSNQARWLGVQVEAELEQARVLLVSVPYALKAADAETLGGKPVSAFLLASSTDGSSAATGGNSRPKTATSETKANVLSAPAGVGNANFLARWLDGANVGVSSLYDNGNIGIGTSAPAARLETAGAYGEAFRLTGGGTNPPMMRMVNGGDEMIIGTEGPTAEQNFVGSLPFASVISSTVAIQNITTGVARMTVDANGNVGVGTAAPVTRLEIANAAGEVLRLSSYSPQIRFPSGPSNLLIGNEGSYAGRTAGGSVPYASIISSEAPIQNIVGGVSRMTILEDGSVGIGTDRPSSLLTVAGSIESSSGFLFPDGKLQTTALPPGCNDNQIPKWAGTTWTCQADVVSNDTVGPELTSIIVGPGITGDTITNSGMVALDVSYTDPRYYHTYKPEQWNTTLGLLTTPMIMSERFNTTIGASALYQGFENTAIGYLAGPNHDCDLSTYVGANSHFSGRFFHPSHRTAIGADAVIGDGEYDTVTLGSVCCWLGDAFVNGGIGTSTPKARLEVASGDVYVSGAAAGVILRSPNGSVCRRFAVDGTGTPTFTAVTCP